jgi:hypothetical protein
MKKNFQKYSLISFFCLLLLATIVISYSKTEKVQIKGALTRVENYYQNSEPSTRFDNLAIQAWLGFRDIEELKLNLKDDPLIRLLDTKLIHQESIKHTIINYDENGKIIGFSAQKLDDFMIRALYCDMNGFNQRDYYLMSKLRDHQGGYGDTHFLIYNLILEKLGCFDSNILQAHRRMVIDTILQSQNRETEFSDLFVERIVVLSWAGRKDLIQKTWVEIILNAQNENGSWVEKNLDYPDEQRRRERVMHATGLATLTLKYYSEKTVENAWYAIQN